MSVKNAATGKFLEMYCGFPHAPRYAVLLKGPWGAGKTYFVKKFFSAARSSGAKREEFKHLYVSLYGMASTKQVEAECFRQLHPILS